MIAIEKKCNPMTYRVKVDFDKKISEKFSIKSIIFLTNVDFSPLFNVRRVTFKGGFRSVCLSPEGDKVPRNFFYPPSPTLLISKLLPIQSFVFQWITGHVHCFLAKKKCSIQSSDNSELTFLAMIAALQVAMSDCLPVCP